MTHELIVPFYMHLQSFNIEQSSASSMIQGTPVNIIVGSHVWTEDPELAWIDGEVLEIKGTDATIVTTTGKNVS